MSVYTDVFGGQNISPSQLDYVSYIMVGDIHAVWPFEALPDAYITPAKVDLQTIVAGARFHMGKANLVSVGQDCLITNRGSLPITVCDVDGNAIVTVNAGIAWLIYVVDNTTPPGVWHSTQFGAGVSMATAGSLAGAGLRAISSVLDQNLPTAAFLSDYTVTQGDRARVLQNNGGSVNWTADTPANLGNGFFFYLMNSGSGSVTFDPPGAVTIDGFTQKVFQPGENAIIFSDGANFFSLGYGRSLTNSVSGAAISLAPGGERTLTPVETAAQVQDYLGTLTEDAIVNYGTGVGYWFVHNNTTGAFDVTARTNVLDPGVTIPQGNFTILRSNGSNMEVAFTATTGTVTSVGVVDGELVGGPITSTGVLGLANTAVAPGMYGAANSVPQITVDQKGRITLAENVLIAIEASQVTDLASLLLLLVPPGTGPIPYSGATMPPGWLWCDGASYTTAMFPNLFAAIGYRYGGAGPNFNVPDMRGIAAAGMDLMSGSLTGNANRISSFVPSTTIGGAGGVQSVGGLPVSVSGSLSGSASGGISGGTTSAIGDHGSAPQVGPDLRFNAFGNHYHNWSGFASLSASVSGSLAGGTTVGFGIVQPTRVFNFMIKA